MSQAKVIGLGLASFALGMVAMWGIDRNTPPASATPDPGAVVAAEPPAPKNPGAVVVELFVMSQCPYGVQAEEAFKEPVQKLGADLDLRIEYIGNVGPGGELNSLHGQPEVTGNMVQLCAMKHSAKWWDFLSCQNESWKQVHTNWEACAKKVGIPVDRLSSCLAGTEGKELLAASFKRSADNGAQGSPTIHIDGASYQGGRRPIDLMRAICEAYKGEKPAACGEIPELPRVNVTLLGDQRCADCNMQGLEGSIRRVIGNPQITTVDYGDAPGKKLFDAIAPISLPAVVFDETLDADQDAAQAISSDLRKVGDFRVISAGEWNPRCADKNGCKLDECKSKLTCRAEKPKKLDVFVMSQCPFGVKGLDAMKEVLEHFDKQGETIDFSVHYIGDGDAKSGLTAMHGQPEVDENIRQVCAIEHYGKGRKYLDYVWCRNKDYKSPSWEPCAKNGIEADVIRKCSESDEGKQLLEESYAHAKALGFGASPTWLVNDKFEFSGVDAETIKTNLCAHNKLKGCDAKLSGSPPPQGGSAPAQQGCE
jgi:2-hydroxychromene-2-carboxylate isomerase